MTSAAESHYRECNRRQAELNRLMLDFQQHEQAMKLFFQQHARLQRVWDEGVALPGAAGIVEYWGRRDFAGLLLMPASRHLVTHWNEGIKVRKKVIN